MPGIPTFSFHPQKAAPKSHKIEWQVRIIQTSVPALQQVKPHGCPACEMGSFRHLRASPEKLIFSPTQREQVLTIENGTNQSIDFEIAAHRSTRTGELSLFQSNLPSGRLAAFTRERILIQYCGEFGQLDTDCAETLQLFFRNPQQELHLITLDCEFELDETGGSVIRTGRQTMRSDGLLLEENLDAIYERNPHHQVPSASGQENTIHPDSFPSSHHQSSCQPISSVPPPISPPRPPGQQPSTQNLTKSRPRNLLASFLGRKPPPSASVCSSSGASALDDHHQGPPAEQGEQLRPVLQRKPAFRKLNCFSRLIFVLSSAVFASLVYVIFFSPVDSSWTRLIKVYGLSKNADSCSFLWSPASPSLLDSFEMYGGKKKCSHSSG